MPDYYLTPPTFIFNALDGRIDHDHLFGRCNYLHVGESILRQSGSYRIARNPSDEDIAASTEVYLGGRSYVLTTQQHDDLVAAGYSGYITAGTP